MAEPATDAKEEIVPSSPALSSVGDSSHRLGDVLKQVDDSVKSSHTNNAWTFDSGEQAQELKRTVVESTDSAFRSARQHVGELQAASSHHFRSLMEYVPKIKSQISVYEDAFFGKLKDGVLLAVEHPDVSGAVALGTGLLLMRRPRRLLIRNILWRFQSEETVFANAQKKVNDFKQSVELLKNESKKLQERAIFAEEELNRGQKKLKDAGHQIQGIVKSVYKTESKAKGLMEILRDLPGREALKLRADVASMADEAKQQRKVLLKHVSRITNYGIPV